MSFLRWVAVSVRPLWLHARRAYLKWAEREMHPLHPDRNELTLELRDIEAELQGRS